MTRTRLVPSPSVEIDREQDGFIKRVWISDGSSPVLCGCCRCRFRIGLGLRRRNRRADMQLVADVAQAVPETRPGAARGAVRVAAGRRRILCGRAAAVGGKDVAGAAAADVGNGRRLLANLGPLEFLVKGDRLPLGSRVDIAGAAASRVEAVRGRTGGRDGGGGNAQGRGRLGSTEVVACAATAGVREAVLEHGGVRLGDGIGRHFECGLDFGSLDGR